MKWKFHHTELMSYSNKRTFSHSTVFHHCGFFNWEENFKDIAWSQLQKESFRRKGCPMMERLKVFLISIALVFFSTCIEIYYFSNFLFHRANCKARRTGFKWPFIWISKLKLYIYMWKIPLEQSFCCFDRFPRIKREIELIFSHSTLTTDSKESTNLS